MSIKNIFWKVLFTLGMVLFLNFVSLPGVQADHHALSTLNNTAPLAGSPFNISTGTIDEVSPAVAYNAVDKEYLVVWQNVRSGVPDDIYAQRISERGELLSWFYVAQGEKPRVAYNPKDNSYLVVYQIFASPDYDVYAKRVNYAGPFGPDYLVAFTLNQNEWYPDVAYNAHPNHDEFLIVWEMSPTSNPTDKNIEGILVPGTEGGTANSVRLTIADDTNLYSAPDLAYNLNMNEYLVVFTRDSAAASGDYDVYARRVTGDGVVLDSVKAIDSSGNSQLNPKVAAYRLNNDTPYLVVFTDYWNDSAGDVRGYLVDKEANPSTLVNIATTSGGIEIGPAIAHHENWDGYFVTWTQGPFLDTDIFGKQISNIGFTEPEFELSAADLISCSREDSDIAVGDVSALAVWSDSCGTAGGMDVLGRMLGYPVYLPLVIR